MSKKLSDFESGQSSLSDSSSDESLEGAPSPRQMEGYKTMNSRKKGWKDKRKASQTPEKQSFFKKPHKSSSPQPLINKEKLN